MSFQIGSEYWLIAIKTTNKKKSFDECKLTIKGLGDVWSFNIPDLKIGTLDSLMALSDQLVQHDIYIETVTKRISRLILENSNNEMDKVAESLRIHDHSIDDYVKNFRWDLAKYPVKQSLKNLVEIIIKLVSTIESDMKTKFAHYTNVRNSLAAIQKTNSGSLATRSLNDIVKKEDFISDSDYLVTLLVIVPRSSFQNWWATYETLTEMVIPRSSKMIYEDKESGLMTVVIFKKFLADFKAAASQNKFIVRDFEFNEENIKKQKKEFVKLQNEKEKTAIIFTKWLKINFSDLFSGWFHIKAIRIFVESVLRYGLPVSFQAMLIEPNGKNNKKLRETLNTTYASMDRCQIEISPEDIKNQDESFKNALSLLDSQTEYYPYVSLTISTKLLDTPNSYT